MEWFDKRNARKISQHKAPSSGDLYSSVADLMERSQIKKPLNVRFGMLEEKFPRIRAL